MKWHGHAGLCVWFAGLFNISVACYGYFFNVGGHTWVAIAVWVGLGAVLVTSVLTVFLDPDRSSAQADGWDGAPGMSGYGKLDGDDSIVGGSLYESPAGRGSMNSLGRGLHA